MKFSIVLLSNVLLAGSALGGLVQRMERRAAAAAARQRKTIPPTRTSLTSANALDVNTSHVQYSSNWAGAVLTAPPAGSTFTAVSAKFTVPTLPAGKNGAASAWVGIDGDTYQTAILQTGVDFTNTGGKLTFNAWFEWYPDYAYDWTGIPIKAGDLMSISVVSSSANAGVATVSNLSTGKTVTQALNSTVPSQSGFGTSVAPLGGKNAEWIVEDFQQGNSLVPLVNFGTVVFTDAVAKTSAGTSLGPAGASLLEIRQPNSASGTVYTNSKVDGATVTVAHTGK